MSPALGGVELAAGLAIALFFLARYGRRRGSPSWAGFWPSPGRELAAALPIGLLLMALGIARLVEG